MAPLMGSGFAIRGRRMSRTRFSSFFVAAITPTALPSSDSASIARSSSSYRLNISTSC
jgi:hypothetical protein